MIAKPILKYLVKRSVSAQRMYRNYRKRQQNQYFPDWNEIIQKEKELWQTAVKKSENGVKVLLGTSTGGHPSASIMDSLLALSLTLRGANVSFLLCDSVLTACQMAEVSLIKPSEFSKYGAAKYSCKGCYNRAASLYEPLELKIHNYSYYVSTDQIAFANELSATIPFDEIKRYTLEGVSVGEHAMAGALRYFARSTLEGQPFSEHVLRRYLKASLLTMFSIQNIIRENNIDIVCVNHGIYVPHGIVAEVGRVEGCKVIAWNVAYRKRSFIFSHGETYHHTLMSEPVSEWENMDWSQSHEKEILDYLLSRRRGGRDWIVFQNRNPNEDLKIIAESLGGVDFSRPCIGMLTNVAWDAQLHYPANAFSNMLEWVIKTIEYFAKRDDLQLIIRIHPAEVLGDIPSKQPVLEEIKKSFPKLPCNVFVIPPQSKISTYAVMEACNSVLIYGTKTGVELTSLGIPVIVAGEAWIRNKGITLDAASVEHYFKVLDQLPLAEGMSEEKIQRARKYAYHFFFRRMILVDQTEPTGGEPQFRINIKSLEDLLPGRSKGLDIICDGIINGNSFVYSAERFGSINE